MSGKSLVLSGRDDVPVYQGKMSDLILNRIRKQNGDNVLMVDQSTKCAFTARDFHKKSVLLAAALKKKGIKEGDVISIVSENRLNYFVPVLATFYLGSTVSPVNPIYSIGELRHAFNLSRPKVVFTSKTALSKVIQLRQEIGCIEEVISLEGGGENGEVADLDTILEKTHLDVNGFEASDFSDGNNAVILASSGTTGLPKGVVITYNSIRYHLLYIELKPYLHINSDEVTLGVVPFFHIFGLFVHLFAILIGMKAILIPKFKPEVYLAAIEEHRVNKLFIVPQLAQFLARSPLLDKFDLDSVNDVFCGSALLGVQILESVEERLHVKLRQIYGLTETGACTIDGPERNGVKTGTVGGLIPMLKAKVRDVETGKPLGQNARGEICIKGPTVTTGYIGNRDATQGAFDEDGYFCTGDVGYYDEDGYFYIVDRLKDIIKYKGFQVDLRKCHVDTSRTHVSAVSGPPSRARNDHTSTPIRRRSRRHRCSGRASWGSPYGSRCEKNRRGSDRTGTSGFGCRASFTFEAPVRGRKIHRESAQDAQWEGHEGAVARRVQIKCNTTSSIGVTSNMSK